MALKILLADDSLTIQKVIKITLANEPFEIVECNKEEELLTKLAQVKPGLVFLDFNLSDNKTGYELCAQIREAHPQCRVLMMYGTFDTIDEDALKKSGAANKVIKPFDSNKFITLCRALADEVTDESMGVGSEPAWEPVAEQSAEENEWVMQETSPKKEIIPEKIQDLSADKMLAQDMAAWGMDVPGVIDGPKAVSKLPPIIAGEGFATSSSIPVAIKEKPQAHKSEEIKATTDSAKLPDEQDLEWPDMDMSDSVEEGPSAASSPKSKLVPLDDLAPIEEQTGNIGESTDLIDLNALESEGDPDEAIKRIEDQIRDELEEDLWQADAVIEEAVQPKFTVVKEEVKTESHDEYSHISFEDHPVHEFDEDMLEPLDAHDPVPGLVEHTLANANTMDTAALKKAILDELRPAIKEMVREAVKELSAQQVDKVAWEVIPDLAENLIKKELEKISNKVMRDI